MQNLLKVFLAAILMLILFLPFQNCGKTPENGRSLSTTESNLPENLSTEGTPLAEEEPIQLTVDNFGLVIESASHVVDTAADCEIRYSTLHPKGKISLTLFMDERELGKVDLNEGASTEENQAGGVLNCSDFDQFALDPGSTSIVSMEITYNDDVGTVRSNVMKLSIGPLVKAAQERDYRSFDHTLHLYSDYSHCRYPRQLNQAGSAISETDFKKIMEYRSGGICNGSFPGSGAEPKDWIYNDPAANPLLKNIPYRYDGTNVNYTGTGLCKMSDSKINVPGLINADLRAATDPVRVKLKSLIAEYYKTKPACQ